MKFGLAALNQIKSALSEAAESLHSDGGSISKVGEPKSNEQIFFTYIQGRQWRSKKFKKKGGSIISTFFVEGIFFGRTNLKLIKKQEKLWGGPGTCSPGKFSKFTCCNGYFSVF